MIGKWTNLVFWCEKGVFLVVLLQKEQTVGKDDHLYGLHFGTTLHQCGNSFESDRESS